MRSALLAHLAACLSASRALPSSHQQQPHPPPPTTTPALAHHTTLPQSKVALYVNRFHLVAQRLRRNKLFRPAQFAGLGGSSGDGSAAGGAGGGAECELTELKALLGLTGERRYVAGFLTQVAAGRGVQGARLWRARACLLEGLPGGGDSAALRAPRSCAASCAHALTPRPCHSHARSPRRGALSWKTCRRACLWTWAARSRPWACSRKTAWWWRRASSRPAAPSRCAGGWVGGRIPQQLCACLLVSTAGQSTNTSWS